MFISRVVKRSLLEQWVENNAHKTYVTKETVDQILAIVEKENVEVSPETNIVDYVFIRIEQVVKDLLKVLPWSQSGGALTVQSPLAQIGTMRYKALSRIEGIKDRHVEYNDPTITIKNDGHRTTLNINTSCEI